MLRDSRLLAMRLPFKCATRIGPGTFWVYCRQLGNYPEAGLREVSPEIADHLPG
jgi:hypothetical protein